jgi:hypothetical protein
MSAGSGADTHSDDRGEMAAVGPLIADAGVPAVLAMQGNVTMKTLKTFMPAFFANLRESGQVDQAVAAARATVKDRPDAWMPVLFMRLKSGLLWYEPEMVFPTDASGQQDFKWSTLIASICEQRCTVIVGPGLLEGLVGSPRTIASRWADDLNFPLPAHETDNLPRIAQYVSTLKNEVELRADLRKWFKKEMQHRHGSNAPPGFDSPRLLDQIDAVGRQLRQVDELEPHKVLAQLPFPYYITANPEDLLTAALTEAGRTPNRQLFRWREDDRHDWNRTRLAEDHPDRVAAQQLPTWDNPLVYHLFGHLDDKVHNSRVVLTEDDYFDYLIRSNADKEDIPEHVLTALIDKDLLFIGFEMSDWMFRVLMRIIASQSGGRPGDRHQVAVQVHPQAGRVEDTMWARNYLEDYFKRAGFGSQQAIFWGKSADFLGKLHEHWFETYRAYPSYPIDFSALEECHCDPMAVE